MEGELLHSGNEQIAKCLTSLIESNWRKIVNDILQSKEVKQAFWCFSTFDHKAGE